MLFAYYKMYNVYYVDRSISYIISFKEINVEEVRIIIKKKKKHFKGFGIVNSILSGGFFS